LVFIKNLLIITKLFRFKKAAKQNCYKSQYELGRCYYYGIGVKKDIQKAIKLYLKSANQNYENAQCQLGCHYFKYNNFKISKPGIHWLKRAAIQGNRISMCNLFNLYFDTLDKEFNQEGNKQGKKKYFIFKSN
jgi:TPR repeat protein